MKMLKLLLMSIILISIQGCMEMTSPDLSDVSFQLIKVTSSNKEAEALEAMYQIELVYRTDLGVTAYETKSMTQYQALLDHQTGFSSNDLMEIESYVTYDDEPEVGKMYHLESINVFDAWKLSSGQGVTVAIIDTGIDTDHLEFQGRILETSYNSYHRKVGLEHVEDDHKHGTTVASTLAAGDDGIGVIGIAPDVNLLVIKSNYDNTSAFRMTAVLEGILYAMNQEVDIINLSLGSTSFNQAFEDTIYQATQQGIVVVGAAGNSSSERPFYPAAYPSSISVSSVSDSDERSHFSNYGDSIDISAPGHNILVTSLNNDIITISGTSFAAPIVSGVVALMKAYMPELTVDDIKSRLYASAIDLGEPGFDKYYGHGKINAYQALVFDEIHIRYETFGGTDIPKTILKQGDIFELPLHPIKDHHQFIGWYEDASFLIPFDGNQPTSSKTLYAKYDVNTYQITIIDDMADTQVLEIPYGDVLQLIIEDIEGYVMKGLYLDQEKTIPFELETMPGEHLTIYVLREKETFSITFLDLEGNVIETHHFLFDAPVDIENPEVTEVTGYTFVSWSRELPDHMPNEHIIIEALYDINTYILTIQIGEEKIFQDVFDYLEEIIIDPTIIVKEITGHSFVSWSEDIPLNMPARHVDIHAIYEKNTYTITYYVDETVYEVIDYLFLDDVISISNPVKEGYTFVSWNEEVPLHMPANDLEFTAIFEINDYQIIFKDGEEAIDTRTHTFETSLEDVSYPEAPLKEGHTFSNWNQELPSHMPAYDLIIEAIYEKNTYTITYVMGEVSESQNYLYLDDITAMTPIEITGYTFTSWDEVIPEVMPSRDLMFQAIYTPTAYTITLNDNEEVTSFMYTIEDETFELSPVTLEGHTFTGWYDAIEGQYITEITKGSTGDVSLEAVYEINTYTLTIQVFDEVTTLTYEYGESIDTIEDPSIEHYQFIGWSLVIPEFMPAEDVMIEARFIHIVEGMTMTITFKITYEDGTIEQIVLEVSSADEILEWMAYYGIEMDNDVVSTN